MKALLASILIVLFSCLMPVLANEERPVNFIFLIDVSGSMLYKSEMVKAADGSQVTLFEALRQALEQIVQDPRLINAKSQTSFITFGTKVTEKTEWPSKISSDKDRQTLISMIHSPDQLSADKHGDTYMGGALSQALQKANSLFSDADPCTTTFIVMLTDGWDEPPPGATIKVRSVASELSQKQRQMLSKLGVKTWQVLVIGLQTLPDRKAGTTTAKELAEILGGGFIDVTKQAGGTVSERIFLALKQQVEALKGQLNVAQSSASGRSSVKNGVVDFGTVNGNGSATAVLPLELKSCYAEEINGITDVSATVPADKQKTLITKAAAMGGSQPFQFCARLPADAVTVKLVEPTFVLAPQSGDQGARVGTVRDISLVVQAHSNCPAGQFVGCFRLTSTAKVPDLIPFIVKIPGRIVVEPESIRVKVKKPGFFWSEPTDIDLVGTIKELAGSHAQANYDIQIIPDSPVLTSGDHKEAVVESRIDSSEINGGKPVVFSLDTGQVDHKQFKLNISIPANQKPGRYEGKLALKVSGPAEVVSPTEIPYTVVIDPSAWEEVAPIAVPLIIILVIVSALGVFLWLTNMRRE